MRIGIDARELGGQSTGVGTYLGRLLGEWQQSAEGRRHEWLLYVPDGRARDDRSGSREVRKSGRHPSTAGLPDGRTAGLSSNFQWRPVAGEASTWWEQRALAGAVRADRPDVLFAPGYTAPLFTGGVPTALTIHDVSYFAQPAWFRRREGLRRRVLTRLSARRARVILTDSESSRNDIVQMVGVEGTRVRVIYPGMSRPSRVAPLESRTRMILFVGSIFNRRRVPDLIQAFAKVAADMPDATLEIVGHDRTHPHQDVQRVARECGAGDRIRIRNYVSDAELEALYDRARVFAFLSEYEGFGFTPLEALAHDVPIVVLDTPIAREIYPDAGVFVKTGDLDGTSRALKTLLEDSAARAQVLGRASKVLDRYRWPDAAAATLDAIEGAAARAQG